jgi:Zn-dependent protease
VYLAEPDHTQFDIRWRMFGVDVRVHPMFWLMSAILGWSALELGLRFLVLWIVCVFVSVLVHELGHVLVGRLFGSEGHIVLYSFGGLAIGSTNVPHRWQRIAVCLAGPFAGFFFLATVLAVLMRLDPPVVSAVLHAVGKNFGLDIPRAFGEAIVPIRSLLAIHGIFNLVWINLFWGLVNLLPVWPLDGGQVSRELFSTWMPGNGVRASLWLSVATAGLIAINAIAAHNGSPIIPFLNISGLYTAFLFGWLALNSFQMLRLLGSSQRAEPETGWERPEWERDPDYWRR